MPKESDTQSRRRFLKSAGSAVIAGVAMGGLSRFSFAADLPHLPESDPTATALGYMEDASKTTDAKHKAGDACANCQFYSGAPSGYGPCQLFPGKAVNAKGWCVSHSSK